MSEIQHTSAQSKLERVLVLHNRYQQAGGEDMVVRAEARLLQQMGHEVELFEEDNDSIVHLAGAMRAAVECVYSPGSARRTERLIESFRPDIVHVHNFFPRLSPAVHLTCHRAGVPVIQTLHNYRLLCPSATLMRRNKVCEECVGKRVAWPAIRYGCYRGSKAGSAVVAGMLAVHREWGTWKNSVSRFIALTDFARKKFIEGGLPAEKITVKSNFLEPDPGMGEGDEDFALFVGRLSHEKGVSVLLEAWDQLSVPIRLVIVGDGPLAGEVQAAVDENSKIEWLGARSRPDVLSLMGKARVLIVPSLCFEGAPMVLVEGMARGLPVIASRLGSLQDLMQSGRTGWLFEPGNCNELAATVNRVTSSADALRAMRYSARAEYESGFTAEAGYRHLMRVYNEAQAEARGATGLA